MSVRVRKGLQFEELLTEEAGVDCERAGGGWAGRKGLGEEFVVGFGAERFFAGGAGCGCVCGCVSLRGAV